MDTIIDGSNVSYNVAIGRGLNCEAIFKLNTSVSVMLRVSCRDSLMEQTFLCTVSAS